MIDMNCPHCGRRLHVAEKYIGVTGRCKYCKERVTVLRPANGPGAASAPVRIEGLERAFRRYARRAPGLSHAARTEALDSIRAASGLSDTEFGRRLELYMAEAEITRRTPERDDEIVFRELPAPKPDSPAIAREPDDPAPDEAAPRNGADIEEPRDQSNGGVPPQLASRPGAAYSIIAESREDAAPMRCGACNAESPPLVLHDGSALCADCAAPGLANAIPVSTTAYIEGFRIVRYLGLATAAAPLPRAAPGEDAAALEDASEKICAALRFSAAQRGGDAVVGVQSTTYHDEAGRRFLQLTGTVVERAAI